MEIALVFGVFIAILYLMINIIATPPKKQHQKKYKKPKRSIRQYITKRYVMKNKQFLYELDSLLFDEYEEVCRYLSIHRKIFDSYIYDMRLNQVYHCSNSIVANAENNPIKFLMKYSNIDNDTSFLEEIDFCIEYINNINRFEYLCDGIVTKIKKIVPFTMKIFIIVEDIPTFLNSVKVKDKELKVPKFEFLYTSPKGNSTNRCIIEITKNVLKNIEEEIYKKNTKSNHIKSQRSAMTNDLREAIKKRDNYTCCICGNSVYNEPNLLLEVDHILPVSKGGKTEASNLQTLCWRCNRYKSDKII